MQNKKFNGGIDYIKFPEELKGSYQNYTKANINKLRSIGYKKRFSSLEQGVLKYIDWLENK